MPKKVLLDCRHLHTGGIGVYIEELMPRVVKLLPNIQFTSLENPDHPLKLANYGGNVSTIYSRSKMYSLKEQVDLFWAARKGFDLVWFPHFTIPFLYRKKMLVTVHDTFHLSFPSISNPIQRLYVRIALWLISSAKSRVLTVSNFSKMEILKHSAVSREAVEVTHNGVRKFAQGYVDGLQLPANFILFVGNLKPHKNLNTLVEAFSKISNRVNQHLVVVGNISDLKTQDEGIAEYKKLLGDRLLLLGRVSDESLANLYKKASVFVSPSLYEGFGLPPLEAALNDCPVLVSAIPAHQEIFGDKVRYFDPNSVTDLALKLEEQLLDQRKLMSSQSEDLRNQFNWDRAALQVAKVIEDYLKV